MSEEKSKIKCIKFLIEYVKLFKIFGQYWFIVGLDELEKLVAKIILRDKKNGAVGVIVFEIEKNVTVDAKVFNRFNTLTILRRVCDELVHFSCQTQSWQCKFARIGDASFAAIFIGKLNSEMLAKLAHTILNNANSEVAQVFQSYSVAVGVACNAPGSERYNVVRLARLATNEARRDGNWKVRTFTDSTAERIYKDQALIRDLREALERQELEILYQPKVDANTLNVVSAEALLRWRHPIMGDISPSEFIPLAERTKLIVNIGSWVVEQVCQQIEKWRQVKFCTKIAINVSAVQLADANFVSSAISSMYRHGIRPNSIIFEITESRQLEQLGVVKENLMRIIDVGVKISIDDFGSGFSNIRQIYRMPFHELKIDREFVNSIEEGGNIISIIKTIIDLGHSLGAVVVGEGVESDQQRVTLMSMGCDILQGYLFSKPLTPINLVNYSKSTIGSRYISDEQVFENTTLPMDLE